MMSNFFISKNLLNKSITHGFFGRQGGVSTGLYKSLNCGFGSSDNLADVTKNRQRAILALTDKNIKLCTPYQIHSNKVVSVSLPWLPKNAPYADALVTNIPGIALGILTADCVPILFADQEAGVVAAAHMGWRGALVGILENTITSMILAGATIPNIKAAIGPCISQTSYEVGSELRDKFLLKNVRFENFFYSNADGKIYFHLTEFASSCLRDAGILSVDTLDFDTFQDEERFFSFRRSSVLKEKDYGRQISTIFLEP